MTLQRPAFRPSTSRRLVVAGITTCAIAIGGAGLATTSHATAETTAAVRQPTWTQQPPIESYEGAERFGYGAGALEASEAVDATAAQEVGLVYITTTLDYGTGQAAGTGMILTSDGEILTNHHVVEGATAISVEVVSTGETYDAEVVGHDATSDVAVLQLDGASGLTPVTTDADETVQVGDEVTGVGNANGDGGAASAAAGTVVALDQSITVSSETGSGESSTLSDLIEVDADIIPGDSGGALYDDDGEVVGMNTAASSGTADITGYAVPIASALAIADQIESGAPSGTVEIGNQGYLGVELSSEVTGALVAGVVDDSAAASAGLTVGSTITSLNGTAMTSADALASAVAQLAVGDRVTVAWTDASGSAHSETVTLGEGPVA
ncbi:MAG: septum formation initiator [Aeromicrobium sp.]|jgi:S1-C subfamily serine protease|nr:septum formation initiator [Aeromicrobium sp.]